MSVLGRVKFCFPSWHPETVHGYPLKIKKLAIGPSPFSSTLKYTFYLQMFHDVSLLFLEVEGIKIHSESVGPFF